MIVLEESMGLLTGQGDLIAFFSLSACVVCATHCVVLSGQEAPERRWMSFFNFYLLQGLAVIWILVFPVPAGRPGGAFVAPALQLFSFASAPPAGRRRKAAILAVVLTLTAACTTAGLLFGPAIFSVLSILLMAFPGAALGMRWLFSASGVRTPGRPLLVVHGWTLAAFGLIALAASAGEAFFPGRVDDALLAARAISTLALAISLSLFAWRSFEHASRGFGWSPVRITILCIYLALPLVLVLGTLVAVRFGEQATEDLGTSLEADTNAILYTFTALTREIERDTAIVAGSPQVEAFLLRPDESQRTEAEEVLNQFAGTLKVDCYLLDAHGKAVAASGALSGGMFYGVSHAGSSFVADALLGKEGRYLGVDPATHERRYFCTSPVRGPGASVAGVALTVWSIPSDFLLTDPAEEAFVVDASGVIFLSRDPDLAGRALWAAPADEGAVEPLLKENPGYGTQVFWRGAPWTLSRAFLNFPGWSVVVVGAMDEVFLYRRMGFLGSLVVFLVINVFLAAGQLSQQGELRIKRSESRYRALVEGSPDWISIVDSSGAFLFTNLAGRASFGDEDPARAIQMASRVREAARTGIISFETSLSVGGGGPRVWRITLVPLQPAENVVTAILIGSDITEMRQAEARLLRAERLAALGTLAAGVAHQFNNINAVALGYVQVLESAKGMPEIARCYLKSVRQALERAVDITTHIMPLSVAPGADEAHVLLGDVMRSVSTSLGAGLAREGVTLDLALEDEMPVTINRHQLDFIVDALLVNARHAVLGQPVRKINVRTGTLDGQSFLRVQDSGIGIARERQSSLFTPFFSEKGEHASPDSPQAQVRGVGLSLAVSHSIVTGKGGRIDVESAPGVGSTFTVWLPAE
jgi:C4-dicarboxylate-specific signal transduction histidine kinase